MSCSTSSFRRCGAAWCGASRSSKKANASRRRQCAPPRRSRPVRPREIYQTEIANALVNAIVDYKGSVGVGANEWLTVAARESVLDRRFVPGDPNDTAITIILRIKGSDLQALREGTLAREDGLKRVDVKHYYVPLDYGSP